MGAGAPPKAATHLATRLHAHQTCLVVRAGTSVVGVRLDEVEFDH